MKRIGSTVGIEQGSKVLFSDFANGGPMWTGQGNRDSRVAVQFKEAFAEQPVVMVGMSMRDMDNATNSRVDLSAEQVTRKGFQLVFKTWGDTRVARVRADWTAIGAVKDDDVWDVE